MLDVGEARVAPLDVVGRPAGGASVGEANGGVAAVRVDGEDCAGGSVVDSAELGVTDAGADLDVVAGAQAVGAAGDGEGVGSELVVLVADGLGAGVELVEVFVVGLADDEGVLACAAVGVGGVEGGVFGLWMGDSHGDPAAAVIARERVRMVAGAPTFIDLIAPT